MHQRPPQFDYIYRANDKAKARAEAEVAELRGKIEELIARRRRLEAEQAGLWVEIAFRAISHYDLDKKPLYRFEPFVDSDLESRHRADTIKAAAAFMASALSIIGEAENDQAATFRKIKPAVTQARQVLNDSFLRLAVDVSDARSNEGRFAALAKRLNDVAANLTDSYVVAMEGDSFKDQQRKETFRALLQESLIDYAQIVLALDEMSTLMKDEWKIKLDLDKPLEVGSLNPVRGREHRKMPGELTNSIGIRMKLVLPGEFVMGSEFGQPNEKPAHKVTLTQPFYLGVYEVTQEQFERVMNKNPSGFKGGQKPVEEVSWDDAVEFCRKLSKLPEEVEGRVYRLPTEAEWEYACRAGTTTEYSFGNDDAQLREYAWFDRNAGGSTHPVGTSQANPWGFHDMHGNVWEWCQDWYGGYSSDSVTDPMGPSSGATRAYRGGSWRDPPGFCRTVSRGNLPPRIRGNGLGFRVALVDSR